MKKGLISITQRLAVTMCFGFYGYSAVETPNRRYTEIQERPTMISSGNNTGSSVDRLIMGDPFSTISLFH
jgi:hypothetical protein